MLTENDKKVSLRPLTLDDTEQIVKWRNLPSVKKNLYSQATLLPEQHIAYFHNVVSAGKCAQYIICVNDDGKQMDIGTTFIKNIDRDSHKGEFGIFIGEEAARGKGYSVAATKQILDIAFRELNLNRVYLSVMADNNFAVKAYQSAGFSIEGTLRQDFLRYDGYVDIIMMAIVKADWEKNLFAPV